MRMAATLLRKTGYSVTLAAAVAFSSATPAGTLGLSDAPLFLATGAQPNLIMAIDDSGSMDNETLFPTNDGAAWWRSNSSGTCTTATDNNSFVGCRNNDDGSSDIPVAGKLNFNNAGNANGTWKKFVYLFPNGLGSGYQTARRRSGDGNNDHFAIPPLPTYAWARSSAHNAAYFDPEVEYTKWKDGGGYTFSNADPAATRFDPIFEAGVTIDLTHDVAGQSNPLPTTTCESLPARSDSDNNFYFKAYQGMTLPQGTCFMATAMQVPDGPDWNDDPDIYDAAPNWQVVRSGNCAVGTVNGCLTTSTSGTTTTDRTFTLLTGTRVAIRYFPATFWLPASRTLADYGYLESKKITGGKAPDGTELIGYQIKEENFEAGKYTAAINNFANWFQYYRKRHMALRAGLGESFASVTGVRVDGFTINDRKDVTMATLDDPVNRSALYTKFYRDWVRSGGTPNRNAVARIIDNYKRTDSGAPITAACQKNFGMLFTDGFSNQPATDDGITGNFDGVDAGEEPPYQDDVDSTMADATLSAFTGPLRTGDDFDLGKVPVKKVCQNLPADDNGRTDCNPDLHMNFYAVTLGARGLLFDPDDENLDPFDATQTPVWPDNFPARHPSAVDDLWHATINGRGKLLNARSPKDISNQLNAVLLSLTEVDSTAASAALNSGSISSDSVIFQAKFFPDTWTGELLSYEINPDNGTLRMDSMRGADLDAPNSREIFTINSSGVGMLFDATSVQADAVRSEQLAPTLAAADRPAEVEKIVNYIRGAATNESTENGGYRIREGRKGSDAPLGDIVNSAPLYVAAPPFRYRDSLEFTSTDPDVAIPDAARYSKFASDNKDRQAMVYVGANDGMLHAFKADKTGRGQEVFAYVPGALFSKLPALTSRTYGHEFYVDGSPSLGDAYFDGAWHTVVAGGLNAGGQGIYALDVTDPETFGANDVLWEFTDEDDPDLGFTYAQPSIVRLANNKWYVVVGNGYNNMLDDDAADATEDTTRVSTTGNAVLYLIELATGEAIKLDTGVGFDERPDDSIPYGNGLATPSAVDVNGDRNVDYVYAGDLYGNMWRFDLRNSNPDNWGVSYSGQPLFKARTDTGQVQPITVRPEVARGPEGNGQIVLFGTGKYLETTDRVITPEVVQSFYGIIDRGSAVTYTTRSTTLLEQTIDYQGPFGDFTVRVTSDAKLSSGKRGWFMDLLNPARYEGEKQVTNPIVRNGAVIFTTLIPSNDPCTFGGNSWLMELDLLDGSRLDTSPFDLNNDGEFDSEDLVQASEDDDEDTTDDNVPASGIYSEEGILQTPGVGDGRYGTEETGKAVQYKYLPGSSGEVQVVIENPRLGGNGRQSWRQIR